MIPPRYDENVASSERKVFDRLRFDPATSDWTILHSLGLTHRGEKPYGEIDFVVLIPGGGVVCLEVKGGRIRCQDGIWFTRDRYDRESVLTRSPFEQAKEGMFALRDQVTRHFGGEDDVSRILYAHGVIFPDISSPPATPEFEDWQVIDIDDLQRPISQSLLRLTAEQAKKIGNGSRKALATPSVINRLRDFLRPDFDVGISRSTSISRSEERLIRLTEEQFDVLDTLMLNRHCLVQGAAGTGKTMLAIEFVRRTAFNHRRVATLCYNRLLGKWIRESMSQQELGSEVISGAFHSCLRRVILASSYREEFLEEEAEARESEKMADFFKASYPLFGCLALESSDQACDLLVIDEGQDLIREEYLEILDCWLVDGLAGGRWVILGDFSRQAIYSSNSRWNRMSEARDLLSRYTDQITLAALHLNCRNTRNIGEETALLSGFDSLPYRLDESESLPVDYRYCASLRSQIRKLEESIEKLLGDRVPPQDIVVLSPVRFEQSIASQVQLEQNVIVRPLTFGAVSAPDRTISFSTIQAYKGLESPVVIICDFQTLQGKYPRSLLYVGMSRARSFLILVLPETLREQVSGSFRRRFAERSLNDPGLHGE